MFESLEKYEKYAAPFLLIGAFLLVSQKINRYINHDDREIGDLIIKIRPHRLFGHSEYFRYKDYLELRVYTGLLGKNFTYYDTDRDGSIDKIIENASILRFSKTIHFYDAKKDLEKRKKEFSEADMRLGIFEYEKDNDYLKMR